MSSSRLRRRSTACAIALMALAWVACEERGSDGSRSGGAGADRGAAVAEERGCFGPPPGSGGAPPDGAPGSVLARELGCAACHAGVPAPDPAASAVALSAAALSDPAWLFGYLRSPRRLREVGRARMPGFHLDAVERVAVALYLESRAAELGEPGATGGATGPGAAAAAPGDATGGPGGAAAVPEPWSLCRDDRARGRAEAVFRRAREDAGAGADTELGGRIYQALGCGGCHGGGAEAAAVAAAGGSPVGPDLADEVARARPRWLSGWLRSPSAVRPFGPRPGSGARMPDFGLSASEADSLAAWLLGRPAPAGEGSGGALGTGAAAGGGATAAPPTDAGTAAAAGPAGLGAAEVRRVERLLERRLPCLGCHRLGGAGGRIGPDLGGVAARRPPAYIEGAVRDPLATLPAGTMPPTRMSEADRALLIRYLSAGAAGSSPPSGRAVPPSPAGPPPVESPLVESPPRDPPSAAAVAARTGDGARSGYLSLVEHPVLPAAVPAAGTPGAAGAGAAAYGRFCAPCHGADGGGNGFNARYLPVPPTPHAAAAPMSVRTDGSLFDAVWAGGRVLGGSPRMPGFGEALGRERTWDLVAAIRRLCDCRGPAWEAERPARDAGAGR